ncbi:MAG TPA: peptide chain release factor N(5)-glutamine methyltransferase [Longimicrobiaceae bacterium]|nr:peptide chain release factor N(5)-glutamine methyltransferase [Longimicrobiaceae bacterium]
MEMVRWTEGYLREKGFESPRLNGELLLAGTLGLKRLDLYLQFDRPLTPDELAEFKARLRRRAKREPLQYIEGQAAFRDLRLRVDPRVLIPRSETELLVDEVLAWAAGREGLHALDVGTGSGAIALSLATEGPFARVVATDVSGDALEVARANHAAAAPGAPVEFYAGAVYAPVRGQSFDVVVSNPPYIGESERGALDAGVRDWEPAQALFSGETGLDVIRELVAGAPGVLRAGGLLALEIGWKQADAVAALVRAVDGFNEPAVRRDLEGRDRIVTAIFGTRE